jgi:hypothetical protein
MSSRLALILSLLLGGSACARTCGPRESSRTAPAPSVSLGPAEPPVPPTFHRGAEGDGPLYATMDGACGGLRIAVLPSKAGSVSIATWRAAGDARMAADRGPLQWARAEQGRWTPHLEDMAGLGRLHAAAALDGYFPEHLRARFSDDATSRSLETRSGTFEGGLWSFDEPARFDEGPRVAEAYRPFRGGYVGVRKRPGVAWGEVSWFDAAGRAVRLPNWDTRTVFALDAREDEIVAVTGTCGSHCVSVERTIGTGSPERWQVQWPQKGTWGERGDTEARDAVLITKGPREMYLAARVGFEVRVAAYNGQTWQTLDALLNTPTLLDAGDEGVWAQLRNGEVHRLSVDATTSPVTMPDDAGWSLADAVPHRGTSVWATKAGQVARRETAGRWSVFELPSRSGFETSEVQVAPIEGRDAWIAVPYRTKAPVLDEEQQPAPVAQDDTDWTLFSTQRPAELRRCVASNTRAGFVSESPPATACATPIAWVGFTQRDDAGADALAHGLAQTDLVPAHAWVWAKTSGGYRLGVRGGDLAKLAAWVERRANEPLYAACAGREDDRPVVGKGDGGAGTSTPVASAPPAPPSVLRPALVGCDVVGVARVGPDTLAYGGTPRSLDFAVLDAQGLHPLDVPSLELPAPGTDMPSLGGQGRYAFEVSLDAEPTIAGWSGRRTLRLLGEGGVRDWDVNALLGRSSLTRAEPWENGSRLRVETCASGSADCVSEFLVEGDGRAPPLVADPKRWIFFADFLGFSSGRAMAFNSFLSTNQTWENHVHIADAGAERARHLKLPTGEAFGVSRPTLVPLSERDVWVVWGGAVLHWDGKAFARKPWPWGDRNETALPQVRVETHGGVALAVWLNGAGEVYVTRNGVHQKLATKIPATDVVLNEQGDGIAVLLDGSGALWRDVDAAPSVLSLPQPSVAATRYHVTNLHPASRPDAVWVTARVEPVADDALDLKRNLAGVSSDLLTTAPLSAALRCAPERLGNHLRRLPPPATGRCTNPLVLISDDGARMDLHEARLRKALTGDPDLRAYRPVRIEAGAHTYLGVASTDEARGARILDAARRQALRPLGMFCAAP